MMAVATCVEAVTLNYYVPPVIADPAAVLSGGN
jgi:hypothetical protein